MRRTRYSPAARLAALRGLLEAELIMVEHLATDLRDWNVKPCGFTSKVALREAINDSIANVAELKRKIDAIELGLSVDGADDDEEDAA